MEYDKNKEFQNRITDIKLQDGTPLEMDKYYKVVVNDFMFTGGDKYDFSNAINVNETYIPIREGLVDAIKEAKVITPKPVDYLIEVSEKEVAESAPEVVTPAKEKAYSKSWRCAMEDS